MTKLRLLTSGRLVAWVAVLLGIAASVAANIAHARPELGPRLTAGFAPLALLLTVELMARIPWPHGWPWQIGRWLGTGIVAAVAGITSYRHLAGLLRTYGEDRLTATIQPLSIDGLMVVASLALLALGHRTPAATSTVDETADAAAAVPVDQADEDQADDEEAATAPEVSWPVRATSARVVSLPAATFSRDGAR